MQITEQLIERIARNVFQQMFMQGLLNANVVRGSTIEHAQKADEATFLGTETVGSAIKMLFLSGGLPVASDANVGSSSQPVYINDGDFTACTGVATSAQLSSLSDTVSGLSGDIGDINSAINGINGEIQDIWDAIHELQPQS